MSYLLDADVFIQAKNLHYGFDFCPAFWDWLIRKNDEGKVFSIEKVSDELEAGGDELSDWASDEGKGLFLGPDQKMLSSMGVVSGWVTKQGYEPSAINTFFQVADYYLIAHAHANGQTVVTHEKPADTVKKIKIPNVCIGLGIKCVTPYEMLRKEKAKFVLGPPP